MPCTTQSPSYRRNAKYPDLQPRTCQALPSPYCPSPAPTVNSSWINRSQSLGSRKVTLLLSLPPGFFILGILLSISNCLAFYEDLFRCFQNPDYETFLLIAQNGLHVSPLPKSVVVIGAGLAGLAAAKTLQDAGHKVRRS